MIDSSLHIRPAIPDEAPLISDLALRSKAYWDYDEAFIAACRPALTFSPDYITANPMYVVEMEGRVAGFYSLQPVSEQEVGLENLFVAPEAIGQGCGKRLWQHAVVTARQLGYQHMLIEADPNAEAFYAAMGAETIGSVPSSVWPNHDLPLMRFPLVMSDE